MKLSLKLRAPLAGRSSARETHKGRRHHTKQTSNLRTSVRLFFRPTSKMAALIPKTTFQTAKRQSVAAASIALQSCSYSQKPRKIDPTLVNMKRGTGGRSSFNGIVCTVFGASGFIGKHLVNRLGKIGTQVIIPYRGDHYDVAPLKVCGDLGQILFHPFDLRDEDSILKCIKYSNVVVNLIGREWETMNFKYEDVNVTGAARLARICKQNGVERFIHLSCLNASPEPEPIILKPKGSRFLKSKWEGEWAVKNEFPDATIIRPATVYGTEDRFIGVYSHKWRMHLRSTPLYKKGEETIKQPIWVGDVANGIVAAIKDPKSAGRTYQFVGPCRYKLSDIVDYIYQLLRRDAEEYGYRRTDINDYQNFLFKYKVMFTEAISLAYPLGMLHFEGLEKEHTSDKVIKGVPTIEDLGIEPIPINAQFAWETYPHRHDSHYEQRAAEYPDLEYPKPLTDAAI